MATVSATAKNKEFREADRAQVSFLAPLEKRCLIWLAHHTPRRDQLRPPHRARPACPAGHRPQLLVAALESRRPAAGHRLPHVELAGRQPGWDSRPRPQPPAPSLRILCRSRGGRLRHLISARRIRTVRVHSPPIAAGLLIAYFMLSIEVYLATYTIGTFHLSFWKFSPTELRILLMIGNIALLTGPWSASSGSATACSMWAARSESPASPPC